MAGRLETPTARSERPQQETDSSEKTREIIKLTQSRKKIYPELTAENLKEYKYKDLVEPLRKNKSDLSKIQKEFMENMDSVEKALGGVGMSSFSYERAKDSATGVNKSYFDQLDRQVTTINSGLSTSVGNPNLEALLSAANQADFEAKMADPNIVQAVYSNDAEFKNRAKKVFDYIQNYRRQNAGSLEKNTIDAYLQDIFSADESELDTKIQNSTIIRGSHLTPEQKNSVTKAYHQYKLYRNRLEDQLKLEKTVKQERETFLSKPIEYAKSGERYVAEKIQTMRDHWAGMDGKEKMLAGLTILIGSAYFLNSENEGIQKTKDALMKAGLLALGYVGINATSKVFTGKSLSNMIGERIEDKSGKRDFLKESFNTDRAGADNMQTSLAVLGNYDFAWLADNYVMEEARIKKFNVPDKHREISVGGVAENEMSPHNIYLAMKLLDDKLKRKNSSIGKMGEELKKAEREALLAGRDFVPPTWAMIITAVLQDQELGIAFGPKGEIRVESSKTIETVWETNNKNRTKKWWPLIGRPKDWKNQIVDKKPKETIHEDQLNKLSSTIIPESKPLSDVISEKNFGRFTRGFNSLYENVYKKRPSDLFHTFQDTAEKAMYVTSKAKVDTQTHSGGTAARLAAVEGAYEQALANLKTQVEQVPALSAYKDRLSEFAQPVFGTFIGPNKDGAKEYVMFLRLTLPGSAEFSLRDKHEWPEGNMMQQMHEKQLTTGDLLNIADFKVMADNKVLEAFKDTKFAKAYKFESPYGGAYESFLARAKLTKDQDTEITKVLAHYSRQFANSGMTRAGLVRYLATHDFNDEEIRTARGLDADAALPNSGTDVYGFIREATISANIFEPTNEKRVYILSYFGTMIASACNGDAAELAKVKALDPSFGDRVEKFGKETDQAKKETLKQEIILQYKQIIERLSLKESPAAQDPSMLDKMVEINFHNSVIAEVEAAKTGATGTEIIERTKAAIKKIENKQGFRDLYIEFNGKLDQAKAMISDDNTDRQVAPNMLRPEIDKEIVKYKKRVNELYPL